MKKQKIVTSVAVVLIISLFYAGLVLAEREEFTGERWRIGVPIPEGVEMAGCRLTIASLTDTFSISSDHCLLDGATLIAESNKLNVGIIRYRDCPDCEMYDCIPSNPPDPPPQVPFCELGIGHSHGPITIIPDSPAAEGGRWVGIWKVFFTRDGTIICSGTARGIGGALEGLTLKIFSDEYELGPTAPFSGYIHMPESKVVTCP